MRFKALLVALVIGATGLGAGAQVLAKPDARDVTLCHKPGTPAEKTLVLPSSAVGGHLGHGDTLGACGQAYP